MKEVVADGAGIAGVVDCSGAFLCEMPDTPKTSDESAPVESFVVVLPDKCEIRLWSFKDMVADRGDGRLPA
jgi:hypothetical protein